MHSNSRGTGSCLGLIAGDNDKWWITSITLLSCLLFHLLLGPCTAIMWETYKTHRYSFFWNPDISLIEAEENKRVQFARDFMDSISPESLWLQQTVRQVSNETLSPTELIDLFLSGVLNRTAPLCIALPSAPRDRNYLLSTVGALLSYMPSEMLSRVPIVVQSARQSHPQAFALKDYFAIITPFFTEANRSYEKSSVGKTLTDKHYYWIKQIDDQLGALLLCSKLSDYVLLLEDDAYPAKDYFDKISNTIKPAIEKNDLNKFAFVKLFYHEYFFGTGTIYKIIGSLLASIVITSLLSLRLTWIRRYPLTRWILIIYISFIIFYPFYFIDFRNLPYYKDSPQFPMGLHETTYPCCCVAHLYHHSSINSIVQFVKHNLTDNVPIDIVYDLWAVAEGRTRYMYRPHLFQHVGIFSTRMQSGGLHRINEFILSRNFEEDLFAGQMN